MVFIKTRFENNIQFPYAQVDATVLKFTPLIVPKIDMEYNILETVVKTLFQYRRKIIRKGARSEQLLYQEGLLWNVEYRNW